ncbi:hypothetical protein BDV12DRAFT_191295 [Aspergillus spectabilis]
MYQLTAADLDITADDETPIIRAAAQTNPAILKALLARYARLRELTKGKTLSHERENMISMLSPSRTVYIYGVVQSPIKAAISASLPDNVRILLVAGADPNGIARVDLQLYSVQWIRGRHRSVDMTSDTPSTPRATALVAAQKNSSISDQVCPLTEAELDERRRTVPRFWTEPEYPGQRLRMDRAITALEAAAAMGNIEILDLLRAAGADESAWLESTSDIITTSSEQLFDIGDGSEAPISALSVSSPVHEALAAGHQPMLHHLLSTCGYCPNYCPRITPTVALSPLAYAIALCNLDSAGVQQCLVDLLSHPRLNTNIRTPIFNVHVLHLATAHHNPELLTWLANFIPEGLSAAGVTALGHTLLHVSSMPLTTSQMVFNTRRIAQSLHCARTLGSRWRCRRIQKPLYDTADRPFHKPEPLTVSQQRAQTDTICVLLEWGGIDIRAQDRDGNTALHYLAGTLNVAKETIKLVLQMDGGEQVWRETRNLWGFTPSDLWEEQQVDFQF